MKKVVITGGHFTPGLALIESLNKKDWETHWIGDENAVSGKNVKTLESRILPGISIPFHKISTAKFHRDSLVRSILLFWKLPFGFIQSFTILLNLRPDIVVSLGSYLSVPVCFSAYLLGIPVLVHEQTASSGLANRMVAKIAKKVAISFPSSTKYFPAGKTVLTGNLIRSSIFEIADLRRKKSVSRPYQIYITGGSRGSQAINNAVYESMEKLLEYGAIIHQCGSLDIDRLEKKADALPPNLRKMYKVSPVFEPKEVEDIFAKVDFAISRSGANTVSELAAIGIPAIFIPLPNAADNEQTKNARLLVEAGTSIILPQDRLTPGSLVQAVDQFTQNLGRFYRNVDPAKSLVPKDAVEKFMSLIEKTAS